METLFVLEYVLASMLQLEAGAIDQDEFRLIMNEAMSFVVEKKDAMRWMQ